METLKKHTEQDNTAESSSPNETTRNTKMGKIAKFFHDRKTAKAEKAEKERKDEEAQRRREMYGVEDIERAYVMAEAEENYRQEQQAAGRQPHELMLDVVSFEASEEYKSGELSRMIQKSLDQLYEWREVHEQRQMPELIKNSQQYNLMRAEENHTENMRDIYRRYRGEERERLAREAEEKYQEELKEMQSSYEARVKEAEEIYQRKKSEYEAKYHEPFERS